MDDIRRPYRGERRDYAMPHRPQPPTPHQPQPQAPPQQPHPEPQTSQPYQPQTPVPHPLPHHQAPAHHGQNHHIPQHHQTYQHHNPAHHETTHHQTQSAHTPLNNAKKKFLKPLLFLIALGLAGGLFGAGYLLRPSSDAAAKGIPPAMVQQVSYNLYFPAPMPHGYSYMKDTATFQIGQVFYKFSNGKKRVTVKEEPMPNPKPDLNLLTGYSQFDAPIGHAAVGTSLGEPTAVVLADTTAITFNGTGGVTQDDLKTAINNLKLIGKNTDKKS